TLICKPRVGACPTTTTTTTTPPTTIQLPTTTTAPASPTTTTPTTTTSTTTTSTTLPGCTTPPCGCQTEEGQPFNRLSFVASQGSANCGFPGQDMPPDPPFAGQLNSDVACTTKISDLGLGCLYIGGADASITAPSLIPDGSNNIFQASCSGALLTEGI